jgi:hypothetical protein
MLMKNSAALFRTAELAEHSVSSMSGFFSKDRIGRSIQRDQEGSGRIKRCAKNAPKPNSTCHSQ